MKRVACLYRVSTKAQVDKKSDDIPLQKNRCKEFSDEQGWEIVKEYCEKGVSGYKKTVAQRDALLSLKDDALNNKFDVLLVFMFDRLGRKDDETPFLVEWFVQHKVEVWSCQEGQQCFSSHVDKLMNYIRFWQASGESEKTSIRIKEAKRQMASAGYFNGGLVPYGYRLEFAGRLAKKGYPIHDVVVNEEEAAVVREIFALSSKNGWGGIRISNYLNAKYLDDSHYIWVSKRVNRLLRNPIYMGRIRLGDELLGYNEKLKIIDEDVFTQVQELIDFRNPNYSARTVPLRTDGAQLLCGILFCGHCGRRMIGSYSVSRPGASKRNVYRCNSKVIRAIGCTGQTTYSAAKIERVVIAAVNDFFCRLKEKLPFDAIEKAIFTEDCNKNTELLTAQTNMSKLKSQETIFKSEVIKSLSGESSFTPTILNQLLEETQANLQKLQRQITSLQDDLKNTVLTKQKKSEQLKKMLNWADTFSNAETEQQKMILAYLIDKITVNKDYDVVIYFNLTAQEFTEGKLHMSFEDVSRDI